MNKIIFSYENTINVIILSVQDVPPRKKIFFRYTYFIISKYPKSATLYKPHIDYNG